MIRQIRIHPEDNSQYRKVSYEFISDAGKIIQSTQYMLNADQWLSLLEITGNPFGQCALAYRNQIPAKKLSVKRFQNTCKRKTDAQLRDMLSKIKHNDLDFPWVQTAKNKKQQAELILQELLSRGKPTPL